MTDVTEQNDELELDAIIEDDPELDTDEDLDVGEGEPVIDPDDDVGGEPQQQTSRATARVQKLAKERDEARREAEENRRRLAELEARQRFDPQAEAFRQAEAARIAAMDPFERERYEDKKQIEALRGEVAQLDFRTKDNLDLARFEAKAEVNPLYKKYLPEVEKRLASLRASGVNAPREEILKHAIGEVALAKTVNGAAQGQRRSTAAAQRVAATRGRPANIRGDTNVGSRGKTEEDRLRGVQI